MTASSLRAWAVASRPRTLVAGFVPVAVGSTLAWHDGYFKWSLAGATLIGALLIQVGTNLANDFFDFKRGADTAERLGPPRASQQGWIQPASVFRAALGCFALAFAVGIYLVVHAGWPLVVIGLASLLAGYAYTGGPYPLAYHGLGDVFVLVFFGLVAVGGTYFVQTHTLTAMALWAGVPVGLLGVALLAVNNTRDYFTDASAGKRTLVVRFGVGFGKGEYVACLLGSALVPLGLWLVGGASAWVMLSWLALPLAVAPLSVLLHQTGKHLNQALADTARLQLVFGLLLAGGLTQ